MTMTPQEKIEGLERALPDLSPVITWLSNGCDPKRAVEELSIYKARIDQALKESRNG